MIIRNDDVAFDTSVDDLQRFCQLCDKHGLKILQGITFRGGIMPIDYRQSNDIIKTFCRDNVITDNKLLVDYLLSRDDLIAVHGLWHTHEPTVDEIDIAKGLLLGIGFNPTYFIPPFNEGEYGNEVCGLKVSNANAQNVEHFLKSDLIPETEIAYTHFWRYGRWYPWEDLDRCLERISRS